MSNFELPRLKPYSDWGSSWLVALGIAVLALPTFYTLSRETWTTEAGTHGPIILATGGWLLWRESRERPASGRPAYRWIMTLGFLASLALYVFGRALDYITLEAGGLYGVGVTVLYSLVGRRALLAMWFPVVYLAFAIPPPSIWLQHLTLPLKELASLVATGVLHALGLPVAREGVIIYVAQYQLLVEDACSGMNSLVGLTAISLLYVYLRRRSSWAYSLALALMAIPIAIAANIARIMVLILITNAFGDEVGQSFIHGMAGLFLFTVALLLVFAVDELLGLAVAKFRKPS